MRLRKIIVIPGLLCGVVLLVGMVLTMGDFEIGGRPLFYPGPNKFRTISIDTQTFYAELSAPFPGRDPPQAEYYTTFRSMSHLSIDHYDGAKNLPYKVRYNYFEADHDKRLRMRERDQELARGPYGTVYAHISFFYGSSRGSAFDVRLYANKAEHEPAQVVDDLPRPMPPLSAISLVRVLRAPPEFAVVRALYDAHGNLKGATIFGSKGGDWSSDSDVEISKERDALRSEPSGRSKYGLPERFPIADYLEREQWVWQDVGSPNPENIINLHYDYNRWVRQDVFDAVGKRTTRYLTYVVTPEDKMLEAIDREVPFGQRKQMPLDKPE